MNLDFAKVCGKHNAIYEAYYKQIDPKGSGAIEAMTAAKFLKKSGLSDVVLSRVWDLSDPNGKGFLDKPGFFVALKLVSLAQAGQVINMSNIYTDTPNPPKVGDIPKIMPPRPPMQSMPIASGGGNVSSDWSIGVIDRLKYEQLFETLKPVGGMLPGNKVKGVLMDSKLPMEILGKIWDLADQDKDGNLDKHEFIVAMHLVYQTLQKRTVPDVLPPELRKSGGGPPPPKPAPPVVAAMPRAPSGEGFADGGFVANFPKDIAPPPAIPPLPIAAVALSSMTRVPPVGAANVGPLISTDPLIPIGAPPSITAAADWVVSAGEMQRFEVMFRDSDRDKDGLVSGLEVKNVFLQSGVPQNCLAHIWSLCDTNQSGKLALEQFALAMWMVERKQKGLEPPQVLTANMVPPSMRSIVSGVDLQLQAEPKPTYSNPELEMISKEIEELAKERRALETEIAQKEADIRIKSGEVRSLQSELDTLSATLKQLENQRGEAQKRLDDLQAQVNKIREQCQKQEDTINEQEGELNAKRSELQKLKDEETALQTEYDDNNRELQKLTQHLQNTQLQISSVRSMVTQLLETQRQMTDALLMCRAAIENQDGELVTEYQLKIEPDFDDARKTLNKKINEPNADPFDDKSAVKSNAAKTSNGFTTNGFGGSDPFAANSSGGQTTRTGFDDSFTASSGFDSGFDAFGGVNSAFGQQKDPFGADAFGVGKVNAVTPEPGKDDFGSDPFAALHAPTGQGQVLSPNPQKSGPPPRPESPSPALPPKKSKVPPPRPAPPRPVQGPARPTQPAMDAFGAPSNSGAFADFADFDNKLPIIPPPIPMTRYTTTPLATATHTLSNSLFDDLANTTTNVLSSSPSSISTSLPLTSTIATATTSSTTINNNLTLQQAASAFSATVSNNNHNNNSRNTPVISGPTEFSDDPFKDYRYEDPFNIKDPFADDVIEDAEKAFKDDLSSDDDTKLKDFKSNAFDNTSTSATTQTLKSAKSHTPISNDFLDQFDAFNMNPSPVPSQQSQQSSNSIGGIFAGSSIGLNKSKSNTPVQMGDNSSGGGGVGGSLFDNFADFDAFSTKSSSTVGSLNATISANNNNNNNINNHDTTTVVTKSKNNDSFLDAFSDTKMFTAFGDEIKSNNNFNGFDASAGSMGNVCDAFDAFSVVASSNSGASPTTNVTKSTKLFDDFDDNNFEDDFFKSKTSFKDNDLNLNSKNNNQNTTTPSTKTNDSNFAQFDAFGAGSNIDAFGASSDFDADFSTALNNSINLSSSDSGASATANTVSKLTKVQNNVAAVSSSFSKPLNTATSAIAENGAKLPPKFVADYSNPDSFDTDLEMALKRSMMDK